MRSVLVTLLAAATLTISAAPALAESSPFAGTWKLNLAKSHLTGDSFAYKTSSDGKITYTYGTVTSYTFACDGSKFATNIPAYTGTCTKASPLAFHFQWYANGKLTDKDAQVISADGATMTDTDTAYRPNGTTATSSATWKRAGSGTGLDGTWKSTKVANSSPDVVAFVSTPAGLVMKNPAYKWTLPVKPDGSKQPISGPTVPANAYVVSTAHGASAMKMTYFVGGKNFGDNTLTVSPDGTTLTWASQSPGAALTTAVYDKR